MNGDQLRALRTRARLTQPQAAKRLGVSQGYLSQLENGKEPLPAKLQRRAVAVFDVSPTLLPVGDIEGWLKLPDPNAKLAEELGKLGYPGFSYLRGQPKTNPAEVLVGALAQPDLESRVAEALPWVVLQFPEMPWEWVFQQVKVHDAQNRLGFVLVLAREAAERKHDFDAAGRLYALEQRLERSKLAREEGFGNEARLTEAERRWLAEHRPEAARRWNVLSDLSVEHLAHV